MLEKRSKHAPRNFEHNGFKPRSVDMGGHMRDRARINELKPQKTHGRTPNMPFLRP